MLPRTAAILFVLLALAPAALAEEWTRFRGPNGGGTSDAKGIPSSWTADDYDWVVDLPGVGHSQPVTWGSKIFLTSAERAGERRLVLCVGAADGAILWKRTIDSATHEKHRLNSHASATPAVDAERLYVPIAHTGQCTLFAFDHDGNDVWRHDMGEFISHHGQALSPIVWEDLVILGKEQGRDAPATAESFILALERKTGKVRWKTPRSTQMVSYSTPCVYRSAGGVDQLICNSSAHGITSLDARNGKPLWWNDCFTLRTVSSPVIAGDLVFGSCGSGGGGNYVVAVRAGGEGDVTSTHEAYRVQQAAGYVPTPLVKGKRLFVLADKGGIASWLDVSTGNVIWRERVDRELEYSASPICIEDRIYCVSQSGVVVVLAAGDEYRLLGRVELGGPCHSTPAVAGGRLYLRTFDEAKGTTRLFSLGGKKLAAGL